MYKFHLIIITLGAYSLPLHMCLCAPVVFVNANWERLSRLHLCPCVSELKWAWFMLGPTEFPSWPLLLQAFQLVYTTRLERTVAESSLYPQNIPPRCLKWLQKNLVVEDGVKWSVRQFCSLHHPRWFPVVQVAVMVLICSQLCFTFSSRELLHVPFGSLVKHHQATEERSPALPPALFHVTWNKVKRTSAADAFWKRVKAALPEARCPMFVSGATEVNLVSLAQEAGSD